MRFAFIVMAAMLVAASAFAATPFKDVPRDHWAYDAIQRCVDAGILQGIDGQFHGKKLLNRYQMAVVVAKILDQVKGGLPAGAAPKPTDIQNLEALTIEFADELALLNVKVSTLEDSFVELKHEVEKLKGTGPAVAGAPAGGGSGFGLTGFAAFAWVKREEETGIGTGLSPYVGHEDQMFFTMPLVALGVAKPLGQGLDFDFRLNYSSDVSTTALAGASNYGLDHAYFKVDELFSKKVGGRVGGMTPPFSTEHNGAFQTCDLTVTPSVLNRTWRQMPFYGLELGPTGTKKAASDIDWNFAFFSGTDYTPPGFISGDYHSYGWGVSEGEPVSDIQDAREDDGNVGMFLFLRKPRGEKGFGFNFAYIDNGGDVTGTPTATPEWSALQLAIEYAKNDLLFIGQYAQGDYTPAGGTVEATNKDWFALINYKLKAKQSLSLRYETVTPDDNLDSVKYITFAWNRLVTDTSMFQLEYLSPDNGNRGPTADDMDDTLIQLRYKVWF